VSALIRVCGRGPSGIRNAALIATLFGAGLRVSEALDLKPSDLDLRNGTVRVRHGKGDRARTVAIDSSGQAFVERWLGKREQLGLSGRQPLFCTISHNERFGNGLDSSYVRRLLPRLAVRAGIHRRVHAHGLRHSLATALAHEGKPLPTITAQLGHSSTAVTHRYLAKIAPTSLPRFVIAHVVTAARGPCPTSNVISQSPQSLAEREANGDGTHEYGDEGETTSAKSAIRSRVFLAGLGAVGAIAVGALLWLSGNGTSTTLGPPSLDVTGIYVDLETKLVTVSGDDVSGSAVRAALRAAGYNAE